MKNQHCIFFLIVYFILFKSYSQEGKILWSKPYLGDSLEASPAVDDDGNVYMLVSNKLYSYTSDGIQRWNKGFIYARGGDANSVSISKDNSIVYVPGTDGIRAFNSEDGSLIWETETYFSAKFGSVVCESIDGKTLYIGSGADHIGDKIEYIYAIDANTGNYFWRKAVDFSNWPECCRGFMAGCSIDMYGHVYLTGQNGMLYAFEDNQKSYIERWVFNLGTESRMPVAIDNNRELIYACSNNSILYKLSFSGTVIDSKDLNAGEVFAALVLSCDGKTIYVNAEDYKLHAISTEDFTEKWNYPFEIWGSDPLIRKDGVIILMGQLEGCARVCAIRDDETSGTLLWRSDKIVNSLFLNETNVNIGPEGNIYVHSGQIDSLGLYAIQGNGEGLSHTSPWAKVMGNMKNNGITNQEQLPEKNFKVETNIEGSGNILLNPKAKSYKNGTEIEILAIANQGYIFDHWTGDLSGNTNPLMLSVYGDLSITANFTPTSSTWEQIDNLNSNIVYDGDWKNLNDSMTFNNSIKYTESLESKLTYKFKGNQIKIYILRLNDISSNVEILLDSVSQGKFNLDQGEKEIALIYNSGVISDKEHTVTLINFSEELFFDYLEYFKTPTLDIQTNRTPITASNFSIYPNPLKGSILHIKANGIKERVQAFFIDINGRALFSKTLYFENTNETEIIFENDFIPGVYFLKLVSRDFGTIIQKVFLIN